MFTAQTWKNGTMVDWIDSYPVRIDSRKQYLQELKKRDLSEG